MYRVNPAYAGRDCIRTTTDKMHGIFGNEHRNETERTLSKRVAIWQLRYMSVCDRRDTNKRFGKERSVAFTVISNSRERSTGAILRVGLGCNGGYASHACVPGPIHTERSTRSIEKSRIHEKTGVPFLRALDSGDAPRFRATLNRQRSLFALFQVLPTSFAGRLARLWRNFG